METIFDRLTAASDESVPENDVIESDDDRGENGDTPAGQYTSKEIKAATQELLKYGLLESDKKPNLYRTALANRSDINNILEPIDLRLDIDDVRGLAFLVVAEHLFNEEEDDWSHPLIRRQRLTLEQSLLVAILRQLYIVHEQEYGVGSDSAVVSVEDLQPQLQIYLGETGSDIRDEKRLRALLESLKNHGIVSDVDEREQFVIRPIITHLANPESLQNLLSHLKSYVESNRHVGEEEDGDAGVQE